MMLVPPGATLGICGVKDGGFEFFSYFSLSVFFPLTLDDYFPPYFRHSIDSPDSLSAS